MATNYGDTIFEGELSPSVTQVNPVVDRSGEYLASGLKSTVDNVNSILFSNDKKAARADAAKNTLFGEIAERVSYYADAREQGVSQDEILRKLRVDSLAWVANNPSLTEDIYTFQNKLLQENGLAGSITRETPIETGNRKKIETATADGWDVSTPQGMQTYDRFLLQTNQLKQIEQEISAATAEGRLVSAKMQNEATLTLHGVVQTGTSWVNNQISKANNLLSETQDPKARTAIIQQTKAAVAQQLAFIGAQKSAGGTVDTSYLTAGIDNIMKTWEETANGTADLSALETAQKTAETQAYMMALQADPKLATLIALDKASKFQDPTMIMQLDAAKMAVYNKLFSSTPTNTDGTTNTSSGKPPDIVESVENVGLVTEVLKDSTKKALNNPEASPEELAAQGNKLFNTMRSVVSYGANDDDAKNFMSVVDLFSDTSVGRFLESHPDLIDMGVATQAQQIIQKQYEGTVLPLVNEKWQEAGNQLLRGGITLPDGSPMDISQDMTRLIEPVWNGAGLEFRVNDQFSNVASARGLAKELNSSISPAVNRMVRTFAHLSGTTDYEKIYNEQYASRLFVPNERENNTTTAQGETAKQIQNSPTTIDNPADLDLEDFSDAEFKKIVESSKAKDPQAMMAAGSPTEIAQAYLGLNENDSEQVKTLSAFISRNAGLNINPATTAWCAAFVDAVLGASGGKGTGKLNARSYLSWGVPVDTPQLGDVVVLQRGEDKNGWKGHVGFYMGENSDGTIKILGGNQGDSVSEDNFDPKKVLGFRRAG